METADGRPPQDGLSSLSDDPEAIPRRKAFSGGLSEAENCKDLW